MPWTTEHIETERLRLRPFRDDDKPMIRELMTDPDVRRYLGGPVTDAAELAALDAAVVGERPNVFCVARKDDDAPLGRVSLDDHRGEWEIGYELAPRAWGAGIASEAVRAVIRWWWAIGPSASLIAVTQTANEASCRLLRSLGFVLEREFEEFGAPQSQFRLERSV